MQGDEQDVPRETAAGLEGERPSVAGGGPASGEVNPQSQENMVDDSSSPDDQSVRAKSQTGGHVTADRWNQ